MLAGPEGAFVGAAAAPVVEQAILAIRDRFGGRSRRRYEQVAREVLKDLSPELADSAFLTGTGDGRSLGEELLESVLTEAAYSYDERRLPYLATLYVSLASGRGDVAEDARMIVRRAQVLSYRQLVLLRLYCVAQKPPWEARLVEAQPAGLGNHPTDGVTIEMNELVDQRLIGMIGADGGTVRFSGTYGGMAGWSASHVTTSGPLALGLQLEALMCLSRIPDDDLTRALVDLGGPEH